MLVCLLEGVHDMSLCVPLYMHVYMHMYDLLCALHEGLTSGRGTVLHHL